MSCTTSIDVLITERCNGNCSHCINKDFRSNAELTINNFSALCDLLPSYGYSQIRLMGGEPTIHKDFKSIVEKAQFAFPKVIVLTNAINEGILDFKPRVDDAVVYNYFTFHNRLNYKKLLLDYPGKRYVSVVFTKDTDTKKLIQRLDDLCSIPDSKNRLIFNFTIDLTEDVFSSGTKIQEKMIQFYNACNDRHIETSYKSSNEIIALYPKCFLDRVELGCIGAAPDKICSRSTPGFIDARLNWRFCHAFPVKVSPVFLNGIAVHNDDLHRIVNDCLQDRLELTSCRCKSCASYKTKCDGSCFALTKLPTYDKLYNEREHNNEI